MAGGKTLGVREMRPGWRRERGHKPGLDPSGHIDDVVANAKVPVRLPKGMEAQAEAAVEGAKRGDAGRIDATERAFVVIDPEGAKDHDDAVWCEAHGKGWRLEVAIADVGAVITPESGLDRAVRRRATSVYLPDRCIAMCPSAITERACALREGGKMRALQGLGGRARRSGAQRHAAVGGAGRALGDGEGALRARPDTALRACERLLRAHHEPHPALRRPALPAGRSCPARDPRGTGPTPTDEAPCEAMNAAERRALGCEREAAQRWTALAIKANPTREWSPGTIMGVANFGVFCESDAVPGVQAMIHVSKLGAGWWERTGVATIESDLGEVWRGGDRVHMQVLDADPWTGRIEARMRTQGEQR